MIVVLIVIASINNFWDKSGDSIIYNGTAIAKQLCLEDGSCLSDALDDNIIHVYCNQSGNICNLYRTNSRHTTLGVTQ